MVLNYIVGFNGANARPPTIREIQTYFKWKSPRAVTYHTERLISQGYLENKGGARGLFPVANKSVNP